MEDFAKEEEVELVSLDGLRELNFGDFDCLTFEEVSEKYPDDVKQIFSGDSSYRFPNGESLDEMYERNILSLENIMAECENIDNVLICVHMGTIRNIMSYLLTKNNDLHWSFKIENASVTCFEFFDGFAIMSNMGHIPYHESLIRSPYSG